MAAPDIVIRAHEAALQRWNDPFPGFASGHDRRTSDAALLGQFYGGLEYAAAHDWLNAGRRLIDKTYVDMLWHVQELTRMRARQPEQIAAALDDFIRDLVAPRWPTLWSLPEIEKQALAVDWVEYLAGHGFGSLHSEAAASRLLFYLCPMLPVFNLSTGHQLGLLAMNGTAESDSYRDFSAHAQLAYGRIAPSLSTVTRPTAMIGDRAQATVVDRVLDDSDWWERRVFDQLLRDHAPVGATPMFGCDDAGQLVHNPSLET
ncbi:MAG: hypothetical protein KDI82_01565 [Gammaproteobacteria bacterium]|nr:hypothetical protein [Gammaproteobacteria bacterium]